MNANQVFAWRKLYQDGSLSAVSAREQVVPASDLAEAMKQIRELQRLLGKKRWKWKFSVKQSSTAEQKN
ncbi:transposase [Burkholderia ubonensis]|nr:transposase [Burkholderia ubonensis]KUZ83712.1 transposase [Burkholderia ubonensis]